MLWYCRFQWHAHTTRQKVAERVIERHQAEGGHRPESLKGWYNLAGGGAGFLLVETDDPHELTSLLQPFMDVVSFDVHAVYEVEYDKRIQELQQVVQQSH